MGLKYIKNTDDATIVCKLRSDKNRQFKFPAKKFDRRNNVTISNGYTEISDEEIELLKEDSQAFAYYTKLGRLSIVDSLPFESMSTEQLITALKTENAALKKQLKEADKSDLQTEIAELKEVIASQEKTIEALDTQLAGKKAEKKKVKEEE